MRFSRLRELRFFFILFSFGVLVWANWLERPVLSEPLVLGTQEAAYFQSRLDIAPAIRETPTAAQPSLPPEEPIYQTGPGSSEPTARPGDLPSPTPDEPDPILRVVIPVLKVDAKVDPVSFSESSGTWDVSKIGDNLALLEPAAGEESDLNIVIAGHVTLRDLSTGPFRYLFMLKPEEEVYLFSQNTVYTYQVREQKVISAEDVDATRNSRNAQLTLLTCTNWDEASRSYLLRRVIFADLIEIERASSTKIQ